MSGPESSYPALLGTADSHLYFFTNGRSFASTRQRCKYGCFIFPYFCFSEEEYYSESTHHRPSPPGEQNQKLKGHVLGPRSGGTTGVAPCSPWAGLGSL